MKIELTKWLCEISGEEYYSDTTPREKIIARQKFIEVTQNFKQAHFIRFDSLKKNGTMIKEIKDQNA